MNDRDILIYSENKYTEQQQLVKKMRLFWSKVLEGKGVGNVESRWYLKG